MQLGHFGVVEDANTTLVRRSIVSVHQRLAAAQKECVGPAQMQRAFKRRLKANAIALHPLDGLRRITDDQPCQVLCRIAFGDT